MPANWPLFLDFANSRLPLKKYPFFTKKGTSVVYVLVRSGGRDLYKSCWQIKCGAAFTSSFFQDPHNRHPHGSPVRAIHGATLWVQILINVFNSSPSGAAYMRQGIGSALVQIMACGLYGAKPLSKPVLVYCQLNSVKGTNFSEIRNGILSFSFTKMHLKLSSAKMAAILSRGRWGHHYKILTTDTPWLARKGMICKLFLVKWRKHDDVIKWKHFPRYWPFVRRIHRSPVNFPHRG